MLAVLFILAQSFVPWYLTPSPEPAKQTPATPEPTVKEVRAQIREEKTDSVVVGKKKAAPDSVAEFKKIIDVAILLPESVQGGVDGNMVDFYNGALIAAKELGNNGRRMKILAYDVEKDLERMSLRDADLIIGPVSKEDILKVDLAYNRNLHIISPLDPKAGALVDSLAIVQVPAPVSCQIKDNVAWIKEEKGVFDEVLVISPDEDSVPNPNKEILSAALSEENLEYRHLKLSEAVKHLENQGSDVTFRILIDGVDELFVTNVLREMTAKCLEGKSVAVYHQARVRSYENLKIEFMHGCNLHVSASYNTDFSDNSTQSFVREYRSLFEVEPNSFAFHGYDCLKYFVGAYDKFGSLWYEHLEEFPHNGLNVSFRFDRQEKTGKTNSGIRRTVYNPDWSVSVQ